ncbi:MAG TPA: RluA family pseudouridine synthase [Myxococcota bacterium]|nr:RluA family pseudouridine synthase [Myxococcota bacterium]
MEPERRFEIAAADAGVRLDQLVARALGVSRGFARKLVAAERVLVGGRPAAKGTALRPGEQVVVLPFARPEEPPAPNPALPLAVLAIQDGLVAIDKPAGQATHPLAHGELDTALNAVIARFPEIAGVGEGGLRSGVVHRLDPGTSGVLVFALRDDAWRAAREAFRAGRVQKRYRARVHGQFVGEREVELRLESRGAHVRVVPQRGRRAVSRIRALRHGVDTSDVEIEMRTGVRHQIRATLAHLGFPIVGDALYGSPTALARHLLHAESIAWDGFAARAPLPAELLGPP